MNETNQSYYPKLSRYERRKLGKKQKAAKQRKLMREAFKGE